MNESLSHVIANDDACNLKIEITCTYAIDKKIISLNNERKKKKKKTFIRSYSTKFPCSSIVH